MTSINHIHIPILTNSGSGPSCFEATSYALENMAGLLISPRQNALNFRHRASEPGYVSDWHVAGDPTLIIIRQGTLRIGLRDGSHRDFSAGDIFIAKDYLSKGVEFDDTIHGHTACLIGETPLLALHLKLGEI